MNEAFYSIQIKTGTDIRAGTEDDVHMELHGASGKYGLMLSKKPHSHYLYPSTLLRIRPRIPDIGPVNQVKVGLANGNSGDHWLLDFINIVHEPSNMHGFFPCGKWITSTVFIDGNDDGKENPTPRKPKPRFVIFKGSNDQYYFHLKASNGEIIAASEGYKAKAGALNGIRSIKRNAVVADTIDSTSRNRN